jgi:hypothetical protein
MVGSRRVGDVRPERLRRAIKAASRVTIVHQRPGRLSSSAFLILAKWDASAGGGRINDGIVPVIFD